MKVKEFMDKYKCGVRYSKDRVTIDGNWNSEILCYMMSGLPKEVRYRTWAFIFRSRNKQLMAMVNGRREYVKNVYALIKDASLERQLPEVDLEKELLIANI